MTKIAIVGNIAAGKSTVEKIIMDKGFTVYDTDKIAHGILENSMEAKKAFPQSVVNEKINRKKLAEIVFSDKKQLKLLESIIHPKVKDFITNIKASTPIFISVPQLFEAKMEQLFDKIVFVSAPEEVRLERLMKRNNLTKEEAQRRIDAQLSEQEKIKKSDWVINNNGSFAKLKQQVDEFLLSLKK